MLRTSCLYEVRKEKYDRGSLEELDHPDVSYPESAILDWESLQELNECFTKYINWARVLEQHNAIFRKQLETLHRIEEVSNLEDGFVEQIKLNRQRISELSSQRTKLKHEWEDAEWVLTEHNNRYRSECEYQQQLRNTLGQLNKEAEAALLRNLGFQIQCQFLQDDISSTKERNKQNFTEIKTYVDILRQMDQANPRVSVVTCGITEEKFLAQRCVPILQSQLEEYGRTLYQLQSENHRLQNETAVLEQTIKSTRESYDDKIQLYNEKINMLYKDIEEAECKLEKHTSKCRYLAIYQASLENELDRYRRIIKKEGGRLNLAISATPVMFSTKLQFGQTTLVGSRGRDLTQAIQDISNAKPRLKVLKKKVLNHKDVTSKETVLEGMERGKPVEEEKEMKEQMDSVLYQNVGGEAEDVPDGSQVSRGFNMLRDLLRGRLGEHKKKVPEPEPEPEPAVDIYTKGRYVTVTGEGSYASPYFSSSPSAGHVFITKTKGATPSDEDLGREIPIPVPVPSPAPSPPPVTPSTPTGNGKEAGNGKNDRKEGDKEADAVGGKYGKSNENGGEEESRHPESDPAQPFKWSNISDDSSHYLPLPLMPLPRVSPSSQFMSYEKIEMAESVKKTSDNNRVKAYKETVVIVETMVEKTSKKMHRGRSY
ncbi:filensin-like [Brienomyrus brachyistius]|uniref:filensin-like n=1 Tax=Brienomyrus brachyistius TaxID=42636 RepID=UPI0020B2A981|nr:filensin-like [Brienomyrus brachyistius]